LTLAECMQMLEIEEGATLEEIKSAYRKIAQRVHPDKHGGDESARRDFVKLTRAYRSLTQAARAVQNDKPIGVCCQCTNFGEVMIGLDGRARCLHCALRAPATGRLLPMPVLVVVKCIGSLCLIGVATFLLIHAIHSGSTAYATAAFIAGFTTLASLTYTCVSVHHCISDRERKLNEAPTRPRRA